MLKAIIVDDVQIVRQTIADFLKQFSNDLTVVGEASSIETALIEIEKHQPDVLFLDVELKDGTSFDLLKKIPFQNYKIIFITAFNHYAITAFKYSAIDYLLKPIDFDELTIAIHKLKEAVNKETIALKFETLFSNLVSTDTLPQKLILKTLDGIYPIEIKKIIRCQADNNYTHFYILDSKPILVSVTLKEYEELLINHNFFRVHQSHLINLQHFSHIKKHEGNFIIMNDQSVIPLAQRKTDSFFEFINKHNTI